MPRNYDIHPDFGKFPRITLRFGRLTLWLINTLLARQCRAIKQKLAVSIDEKAVTGQSGNEYRLTVLSPDDLSTPAPALIYYHGGAFAITYSTLHLESCARYANEAKCVVVFVDYRLAPRHPFPASFDDSYDALVWTIDHAAEIGIDPQRIAVGGDSAGGALAAGVAQKSRDEGGAKLRGQLLIYPVLDNTCSTVSATEFTDVPLFNAKSNRNMWRMYLGAHEEGTAPLYAAPGHQSTDNLPPSYVETAEFDPLRDEGLAYAKKLQSSGVTTTLNETKQTIHGYDGNADSDIAQRSMNKRITFLQQVFAR